MTDRMTAAEEARRERELAQARDDKHHAMRAILMSCAQVFDAFNKIDRYLIVGETLRVSDDGSCSVILEVDMALLEHRSKKKASDRKLLFFSAVSALKDAFIDMAPRRKITPFSLTVLDRAGTVVTNVAVP